MVGKHNWPRQRGFDHFFGTIHGAGSFYDPVSLTLENELIEPEGDDFYYTTAIGDHAAEFIEESPRDKPFFLYLPFNIPHYPLQATEKWRKIYAGYPSPRRQYAALVSTLDEKVGQILAKVDELDLRRNTLIIFMSDHGHSTEERTMFGGGYAGPYRGAKFSLFEGASGFPPSSACPVSFPRARCVINWRPPWTGCPPSRR